MKTCWKTLVLFTFATVTAAGPGQAEVDESAAVHPILGTDSDVVLAETANLRRTPAADRAGVIRTAAAAPATGTLAAVTIDYPLADSVFPPEIVAPTFLWHDAAEASDTWLVDVALAGGHVYALSAGRAPRPGEIDPRCVSATNKDYQPTPYQRSERSWTPATDVWAAIRKESMEKPVTVTIAGFRAAEPGRVLSRGQLRITTSADPVGAPIFYRDVPLMPVETEQGVIQPLATALLPLIQWRLRDVSRDSGRVVLHDLGTCGNCHSFSRDGKTLGMDIDGPTGDKGAYAIAPISPEMTIEAKDIITWNSFTNKAPGQKTIGFLSQVSPDGKIAVSTVNEQVYVCNFPNFRFLQVFYPTRGILAWYNTDTKEMKSLPGADDPRYVQCDPAWSPDGRWIVFARAPATDAYVPGKPLARYPNDPNETRVRYDLYRIPFNGGEGGRPEPIPGASENEMSNTFPKVTPDGRWIVFVKCRNGQLMRPDGRLWIVPWAGGDAREMQCNTALMNSWHSFSPNGRWMVFSSKINTPFTQMFLTHFDENGNTTPPVLVPNSTAANRAVNIPEFVNIPYDGLQSIVAPTVEYYRDLTRGIELTKAGQYAEAETALRRALAQEPGSSRINCQMGVVLMEQTRNEEALPFFQRALEENPRMPDAHCNLGSALLNLRRYPEAVAQFEQTGLTGAMADALHAGWGAALIALGKPTEAIEHLRLAVAANPRLDRAEANLGTLLALQGQNEEAMAHLEGALKTNPRNANAHLSLGQVLTILGRGNAALEHFRAAIDSNPDLAGAHKAMAAYYLQRGDPVAAAPYQARAVELEPANVATRCDLGLILARQEKMTEALAQFEKAVALDPRSAQAQFGLGKVRLSMGQPREAIEHFQKAVAIDPGLSQAREELESAQRAAGAR